MTQAAQSAEASTASVQESTALDKVLDKSIEYIPFLSEQQISLTPRMVIRFMCKPTKSGRRATLEQALHFCMLCKARGLNPWEGDAFLVGYDTADGPEFSLITAHQAFLKRAEIHPEYDGMKSGVIVKRGDEILELEGDFYLDNDALLGGWAKVLFKARTNPVYKRLRLSVFNKGFGRWKVDPGGMIVKCAEADALRSAFPNSLGGMYLEDEMPGKYTNDGAPNGNGVIETKPISKAERMAAQLQNHPIVAEQPVIDVEAVTTEPEQQTAPQKPVDEKAEKKKLRASIKTKMDELGWDEKRRDQHLDGRDINAFSLSELTGLNDGLTEILAES